MKKILIITGSPRKGGNTDTLAEGFARGAKAAGNEVEFFDAATCDMDSCHGDQSCFERGFCGLKDDGVKMNALMRWADVLVLASPLYWKSFSSQIKRVIDRFYQFSAPKGKATLGVKESVLITAGASPDTAAYDGIIESFELVNSLLGFDSRGVLVAAGLAGAGEIDDHPDYLKKAIEMGYTI